MRERTSSTVIIISEFMDDSAIDRMRSSCDILYDSSLVDSRERLIELLSSSSVRGLIVRNRTQVDSELLSAASSLEVIGRLGVGLDNIDTELCKKRNIEVIPATGANSHSVVEYVLTSALMLLRGSYGSTSRIVSGDWNRESAVGRELASKTLGLVGLGFIARRVAAYATLFGMNVVAHDPHLLADDSAWQSVRNVSLDGVAELSDVVSLHIPLTPTTRHLIGSNFFDLMKSDAVLINTSRGGVLDESALVDALKNERLGGAALDVFESEPLDSSSGSFFSGIENLILTPHIAGVTVESNLRVSHFVAERVLTSLGFLDDERNSTDSN